MPFQLNVPGQPTSSQTGAILWSQQPPAHAPNVIFSWKTDAYRRLAHERWHPRASSLLKSLYFHERLMLIIMGVHRHTNPRTSGLSVILHAPFKLSLTSGDSYRLKLNTNTVFEFYLCYRMYDLLDVWWHALVCLAKVWLWKLLESATPPDTRNSQIPDALNFGRSLKPNFWQAHHASRALLNWLKWYSTLTRAYLYPWMKGKGKGKGE